MFVQESNFARIQSLLFCKLLLKIINYLVYFLSLCLVAKITALIRNLLRCFFIETKNLAKAVSISDYLEA